MLEELGGYLQLNGVGTLGSVDPVAIFIGEMQASPDDAVALFETKGMPPEIVDNIDYAGLQVMTRSLRYPTADDLIQSCYTLLHGLYETRLPDSSGARYLLVKARQPPFSMGSDKQQRHHLAVNFLVVRANPGRVGVGP